MKNNSFSSILRHGGQRQTFRYWLKGAVTIATCAFASCGMHSSTVFGDLTKVTVYTSGAEGYAVYRIPTIVKAGNGDLLAFAEARESGSDFGEIDIVVKRSQDSGQTWGSLQVVQDNVDFIQYFDHTNLPPVTVGNPSPVVDMLNPQNPGRIWLPFVLENDRVFISYSDDHGATWSPHTEITSTAKLPEWTWYATGPVHGIQLQRGPHAGRLIIPSDHQTSAAPSSGVHMLYSDDHGQTWQIGATETHLKAFTNTTPSENFAVELVDGRVYVNARDAQPSNPGNRSINYSSDGGLSFDGTFKHETRISSPIVQNSATRFRATDMGDAENVILYSSPGDPEIRRDLTILASLDETVSWTRKTVIHEGPAAYSDIIKLNGSQFGVLFEAGAQLYDEILFASMDYDDMSLAGWNGIKGDVNQDGTLDEQDLPYFVSVWTPLQYMPYEDTWHSYTSGDLNFDGYNNLSDVAIMRMALLEAALPLEGLNQLTVVPEPSSLSCLLGLWFLSRRHRGEL